MESDRRETVARLKDASLSKRRRVREAVPGRSEDRAPRRSSRGTGRNEESRRGSLRGASLIERDVPVHYGPRPSRRGSAREEKGKEREREEERERIGGIHPFPLIANHQLRARRPAPKTPRSILTNRCVARLRNFTAVRGPRRLPPPSRLSLGAPRDISRRPSTSLFGRRAEPCA